MSAPKKRKISGWSGLELDLTLTQLRKLLDPLSEQLDNMIATLESRVNNPLSLSFSAAEHRTLGRFGISRKGLLHLHPEACKAFITSRTLCFDKLWSNDNMYKHLTFLANSLTNEFSSRMIIDTIFFRSTAMVPSPQKVIVMLENQVSAVHPRQSQLDTISGIVDYTAIVAESSIAENFILIPPAISREYSDEMIAFFVTEAKATGITILLEKHLPQVILELVACAKHLGKSHIRGAITTGMKWHFVVVDLGADDDGANYWVSEPIEWKWKIKRDQTSSKRVVEETTDESDPALIAGILSSWIPQSFTKFNDDQWFVRKPGGGHALREAVYNYSPRPR